MELKVIETILMALKGSNKPFIATSGSAGLGNQVEPFDETVSLDAYKGTRIEAEKSIVAVCAVVQIYCKYLAPLAHDSC